MQRKVVVSMFQLRKLCSVSLNHNFIFRQLFDKGSSTYTYLLADKKTQEAIIIDPVIDCVERDSTLINELGLKLIYAVNTHVHADHITGSGKLKSRFSGCRSVLSTQSKALADVLVSHGDTIEFGNFSVEARATPGHTNGCCTYVIHSLKMAFTGDALLIRGCGRTDFQEGNPSLLYDSVHQKIFTLPLDTLLYPAHDYKGFSVTTVKEELEFNPRLTQPKEKFISIMNALNLDPPQKIGISVKANKVCGLYDLPPEFE